MKKRYKAGIVAGVLLGISLSSLAVHAPFLENRWTASRAATDLSDRLMALDGVENATAAYDPVGLPQPTLTVTVAFRSGVTPSDWGAASRLIASRTARDDLDGVTTSAQLTAKDGPTTARVDQLLESPSSLVADIAAWRALQTRFGPVVSLHLARDNGATGTPTRYYSIATTADTAHAARLWPAAASAVDDSIPTRWSAPGLQISGTPTTTEMQTLAALADVVPLASPKPNDNQDGDYAIILGDYRGFKVEVHAFHRGAPADVQPDRQAADAARVALRSGAPTFGWVSATSAATLVAGECGTYGSKARPIVTRFTADATATRFAERMRAAGLTLPAGVRAGACTPATQTP